MINKALTVFKRKEKEENMRNSKYNQPIFYQDGNITVCLLVVDGEVVARGLSIFSAADTFFSIDHGKETAYHRAQEALGRQDNCQEIDVMAPRGNASIFDWFHLSLARAHYGPFKAYYRPKLTYAEKMLMKVQY